MNKYGPKAQKEVEKTMHEYKEGKLKSGKSDKKAQTSRSHRPVQSPQKRRQSAAQIR